MFDQLAAPFPADRVSWRVGSMSKDKTKAKALAYLDARDVMCRLDDVCTPAGWQCRYVPMPNGTMCCEIGIKCSDEWIWKANGAGGTDVEAEKGAYSDAFKRAAVLWGIGKYLYDIDSPWVAIDEYKRIVKTEWPKLRALLGNSETVSNVQTLPKAQSRETYSRLSLGLKHCGSVEDLRTFWIAEQAAISSLPHDWQEELTKEKDDLKSLFTARAA